MKKRESSLFPGFSSFCLPNSCPSPSQELFLPSLFFVFLLIACYFLFLTRRRSTSSDIILSLLWFTLNGSVSKKVLKPCLPETIQSGFSPLSPRNFLLTLSIHPHPKFGPESLELHCCLQLSKFFPTLSFYSSFTASSSSSFSPRVIGTKIDEIVTHGLQLVYQVFVLTNGNRRWKESET